MAFKPHNLWPFGCWNNCVRSELETTGRMKTWPVSRHYHRIWLVGLMNTMQRPREKPFVIRINWMNRRWFKVNAKSPWLAKCDFGSNWTR